MKKLIILLLLAIPLISSAQYWGLFGPDSVGINNYYARETTGLEVLCADNGLYIQGDEFVHVPSSNLPAYGAVDLNDSIMLYIIGDGSYSDGIYKYNFNTEQTNVVEYTFKPASILKYNNSFYVTFEGGVKKSEDGVVWENISTFTGKNCKAMARSGEHFVISTIGDPTELYYSNDYGQTWNTCLNAPTNLPVVDMFFDYSEKLYLVLPYTSNSSGLYSSNNYGETISFEFYSDNLNAVYCDFGMTFVGWHSSIDENVSVAIWDTVSNHLHFQNPPPNKNINKIGSHPLIDCVNIICCTDSGAYITCDLQANIKLPIDVLPNIKIAPNPFNDYTNIYIDGMNSSNVDIEVYNVLGKRIDFKMTYSYNRIKVDKGNNSPGLYFINFRYDDIIETKRFVVN